MPTTVRQQYNRIAPIYDHVWSRYVAKSLAVLKDWANLEPTSTVLDVGCGTGSFERLVLQESPRQLITGIDVSEKMLEIAQRKCQPYPQVCFCRASVVALPLADHSFDVVVSASTLHHFPEPLIALAEMKRVLKPGGKLVMLDWCNDDWLCQIYDAVLKQLDPAHVRCYRQSEFHQLLCQASFEIQRSDRFRIGPAWELMIALANPSPMPRVAEY
jgi:ubiquinone/menaquinone biosynthesis C-methylase UbiE